MGRVRTKTVKKASKVIVEKYFAKLNTDFQTNKKVCEEVAIIPTKALRNKIAGYVTHLMRRIQKGPVRGISLKVQEEERARRMDYIPDISYVDEQINKGLEVDEETAAMLDTVGMGKLDNLHKVAVSFPTHARRFRKGARVQRK